MKHLTQEQRVDLAEKIAEDLIGHCAISSVCNGYIPYWKEAFDVEFEDYRSAVEFAQENHAEIWECEDCGWFHELLHYTTAGASVCDSCLEYNDHEEA